MATEKTYTDVQLLQLTTTDGLSIAQLERRGALCRMQAETVDLEKRSAENQKYIDAKEQAQRQWKAKCADIAAQQAEEKRIQGICRHRTGGTDRPGFYEGDGTVYGASISKQVLPDGSAYALCFRCGRTWAHPSFVMKFYPGYGSEKLSGIAAVIAGAKPLGEYFLEEHEYHEAMHVRAKTFETMNGELAESVRFIIPALEARRAKEKAEFQEFLSKIPPRELAAAKAAGLTQ